jgi:hypothetical protein
LLSVFLDFIGIRNEDEIASSLARSINHGRISHSPRVNNDLGKSHCFINHTGKNIIAIGISNPDLLDPDQAPPN